MKKGEKNVFDLTMTKSLWVLGAPTILEQALQTAVVYIDTAMVGHIGAQASAAVGLTATVSWLFNGVFFALSIGLLSFIARYTGAGDMDSAHRTSVQAFWILIVLSVVETIVSLAISPVLPIWMGASQEIWHDASVYFFITSAPMIFRGANIIFGNVLRANKDTKTPMLVNIFVNVLNIVLNQLLIGAGTDLNLAGITITVPGMGWGVAGAAVATAVSQSFGGIVIFLALLRNPLTTPKGYSIAPDFSLLSKCVHVSLPLMAERFVMGMGYVVFSALVAGLGTLSTAAHSIAITIEEAFYVPGYGIQTAVSTLAGNAVGRKDEKELWNVVKAGLFIAVSIMTFMSVFLFFGASWILKIFTADKDVIALGAAVLKIVAVSEPLFAVLIIFEGIFHGIGETKMPFCFALLTMWGIRIGMTWILTKRFHAGLQIIWICMVADNVCRCFLLTLWYRLKKWKKRLNLA